MPDSAAFFISYRPGPQRSAFVLPSGKVVFIRAVEFPDADVSEALDLAGGHQLMDESAMNTHQTTEPTE